MHAATSRPSLAALVLAGGRARRMQGADKPLMTLGGQPLIAHVLTALWAPGRPMAISANGDTQRLAAFGLPVLADRAADFPGPLEGILNGLIWARTLGAGHLITAPADCPFLPADLAGRLMARAGAGTIVHARAGGRDHPTLALWPLAAIPALEAALAEGKNRLMRFVEDFGTLAVDWPEEDAFLNINTPEDLAHAEALLAQRANT